MIIGMIVLQIRKRKESQQSILMRILANYLQIITLAMSYSLNFPNILGDILIPADRVGGAGNTFLSID